MNENIEQTANTTQVLILEHTIGTAIAEMQLPKSVVEKLLGDKTAVKRATIEIFKKLGVEYTVDKDAEIKKLLEIYFREVYDFSLSLEKVVFPDAPVAGRMVCPKELTEDRIMDALAKRYSIKKSSYETPIAQKIRNTQSRPDGLYPFAYDMCDEPDAQHLGKSYDNAMSAGFPFANAKEYLLMTGFHKFTKGYFMDKKGSTRTSSLWSDGGLVFSKWFGGLSRLRLYWSLVGGRASDGGPRQLFL